MWVGTGIYGVLNPISLLEAQFRHNAVNIHRRLKRISENKPD